MPVMGVAKFERFFRAAASLDVDKDDLKRYNDFIDTQIDDLVIRAEAFAKANGRDVIERMDLPITKGVQERIHEFEKLDEDIDLEPILERLAAVPQLDLEFSEEAKQYVPLFAGGVSVALARSFRIIDPKLKNPASEEWERSFRLFALLM